MRKYMAQLIYHQLLSDFKKNEFLTTSPLFEKLKIFLKINTDALSVVLMATAFGVAEVNIKKEEATFSLALCNWLTNLIKEERLEEIILNDEESVIVCCKISAFHPNFAKICVRYLAGVMDGMREGSPDDKKVRKREVEIAELYFSTMKAGDSKSHAIVKQAIDEYFSTRPADLLLFRKRCLLNDGP
ncbi:uncharacterized protein LOC135143473 [Zophobas morio]|uniref:uncharacterized protein LOC135143473 n=1 Tax=Zophobas morio TaxID=2755281 RepID=UPI0030836F37